MKRPAAAMSVMKRPSAASSFPKPDWYDVLDEKARLQNYLISAAKLVNDEDQTTSEVPLQDPAKTTEEQFQAALFDSFNNPIYGFGRPRTRPVDLDAYFLSKLPTTTLASGFISKNTSFCRSSWQCGSVMALPRIGALLIRSAGPSFDISTCPQSASPWWTHILLSGREMVAS